MLLATMIVLLQMPFAPAGKLPATPQSAPVLMAENRPAKLPLTDPSQNLFTPATGKDLFDRDKIRLVNLSDASTTDAPAADGTKTDGTSSDGTHETAVRVPPSDSDANMMALAEVHIPTHVEPAPPDVFRPGHIEAERHGHAWLALSIMDHSAATFDAWSTRRAISQGHTEMNPMLRPFAGNASIYGAVQVAPVLFDYLGKRMQRSENRWMRQMWWLPQTLSGAASIFAGAHNMSVTK